MVKVKSASMLERERDDAVVDRLRDGLKIERENLDEVVEQQSVLFLEIAEMAVAAGSKRDQAKVDMDTAYSTACQYIRLDAAQKDEKITEGRVKELADADDNYQEAQERFLKAKARSDALWQLREAYDMRAKMIKELCNLYVAGYWSSTSTSATRRMDSEAAKAGRRAYEDSPKRKRE